MAVGITLVVIPVEAKGEESGMPHEGLSRPHGLEGSQIGADSSATPRIPELQASIQALTSVGKDVVYAGSFGLGIFRSEDRGHRWTAANHGLTDPFILSLAVGQDGTVYAGTFRGGVFRSRDRGKSWAAINEGLKRLEIKTLLIDDGTAYAGTGDGVYRLNESSDRWTAVTTGLDEILVHALAQTADGTLFAGTSGKGVLRYRKRQSGWVRLREGLKDHEGLVENFIRVLTIDQEQNVYAGTFDGGVFHSADGGQSWRAISRALPNDSIRAIVSTEQGLFVGTGRGIYKTTDRGRQWSPLNKGLENLSVQVLIAAEGGILYVGTSGGVFRSDNAGQSWLSASTGLEGAPPPPFMDLLR